MLLKGLTAHVQRQIIGVDNTLDECQVLGQDVVDLVGDEHTAYVQLQITNVDSGKNKQELKYIQ